MSREDRRHFLGMIGAAAVVGACGASQEKTPPQTSVSGAGGSDGGQGGSDGGQGGTPVEEGGGGGSPAMVCTPSPDNILGPYYRSGAPFRTDLTELATVGTRITVSGRVLDRDCQPIQGALLDVWQADDGGGYDNDGQNDPPPDEFVLRGRMTADGDGRYSFRTIIPGRYLNGGQYRPAHLHVTVSAPGFVSLTTQLYFEGDPFNDIDAWYLAALELALEDVGQEKAAEFDFVLEPA